ncbi:glycosyltransferase family 4 protein [candidate division WOR-3 bacterium]|nr:glycosyltransferase family 4 protein [candidate division WOR-3 bacterium]
MIKLCILGDASSIHIKKWVNYFVDRDIETHLISLEKSIGTKGIEHIFHSKIKLNWLKYPLVSYQIARLVKEISPSIVNAHLVPNYGLIGALIGFKPLVISCWGSADVLEPPKKLFLRKARLRYALRKATLITTDGEVLRDAVVKLGIPKSKILNVPMGIDPTIFNPLPKKSTKDVFHIVNLRKLDSIYNPKLFIRALPTVISELKGKIKITISGDGSQKKQINKLIKTLNISNIKFISKLTQYEIAKILKKSDIYVSPSLSDSTSVTLLEAMACGAFPIVTDIPGNREWIKDNENGYLVPTDNPHILSKKIIQALKNPELLKTAAKRNISIIKNKALWKDNMKTVEEAFYKISC